MADLVFATGNPNKVREVNQLLDETWTVRSLAALGIEEELAEDQDTLEGNALQKARYVYTQLGRDCFAEDTGLEIEALDGAPGVYSARYAGDGKDPEANMDRALRELEGKTNRRARFRTVVALILGGEEFLFEGVAPGTIRLKKAGVDGFGYDPIFEPDGFAVTFAEMDAATKNQISHRGKAIRALAAFLKERQEPSLH